MPLPLSIFIIRKGETTVLFQQGGSINQGGRNAPMYCVNLGGTNALWNKISTFQQLTDETIAEAWERLLDYISTCPHHSMEEWFIIQSFCHGLIHTTHEHIDAAAGGSFFALSIEEARKLIEKWLLIRAGMMSILHPTPARFTSLKRWACSPPRLIFL
jgi:hypothetical protein